MILSIKLFGILMIISGLSLLIKPETIFYWIETNIQSTLLYNSAILVRLLFGVLFIITAKESKYPTIIKILGYLFIIAAVVLIFLGSEHFQEFIKSIIPATRPLTSVIGLLVFAFGGFLLYSFKKNKEIRNK